MVVFDTIYFQLIHHNVVNFNVDLIMVWIDSYAGSGGGWVRGDSTVWLAKLSLIFSNNSCSCIS